MSSDEDKVTVKCVPEARHMGTCAGVGICEPDAPAEGAATCGNGRSGSDYVVHEIQRLELHEAACADDGVLFHCETEKTAHAATGGRFHGVGAAKGTFDTGADH